MVGETINVEKKELSENVRKIQYFMTRTTSMITEIGQGLQFEDSEMDRVKRAVMDKLTEAAFWIQYLADFEMVKDNKVGVTLRKKPEVVENA